MTKITGTIELAWHTYNCSVENGIRYVDWVTIDEFLTRAPIDVIEQAAWLWREIEKSKKK